MRWAVILAGGSGSRFWPLSTPSTPKQILPLAGTQSTAEQAVARLHGQQSVLSETRTFAQRVRADLGRMHGPQAPQMDDPRRRFHRFHEVTPCRAS